MDINQLFRDATNFHVDGDFSNAESLYKRILSISHRNFDSLHRLAILYSQANNFDGALDYYRKALHVNPTSSEVLFNRANLFISQNLPNEALLDIDKALLLARNNADLYLIKGNAHKLLKEFDEAIRCYSIALSIQPHMYEALCNRGVVLKELKKYTEAIIDFTKSISLNYNSYDNYSNRAATYIELRMYDLALSDLNRALELKPNFDDALYNLSTLYKNRKQLNEAIFSYKNVLKVNPNHIESVINLSILLQETGQFDAAYTYFTRALEIEPQFRFNRSTFLTLKCKLCIWDDFDDEVNTVINDIADTSKVATPFHLLGLIDRPDLHLSAAKSYVEKECPPDFSLGFIQSRDLSGKIRLGYYSADFHNHATSYLIVELFELHDKNRFELFAFSFGPKREDEMFFRLSNIFNNFIDVTDMSDEEITLLSRKLLIDIAVDLKGFTQDARPNIFAKRCAPIQVSYLGYPGTLGTEYFDYILADRIVIPDSEKINYTEKVYYLPNCYQVNDSNRFISDKVFSKLELGLPESGFIYCCFNNCYKILPNIFNIWMEILRAVDNSVLWLLDDNPTATANLITEASKHGVEKHRLVFAKRMKLDDHLSRHRLADLFLDTLPYNAHTTASDALWAGLPVLTCLGKSFASRVGGSLLHSLNLSELVTSSLEDYKFKAIEFGQQPEKILTMRQRLSLNINTEPLFNTKLFARNIEQAYLNMINDHNQS